MRLVTYSSANLGGPRIGAMTEEGLVDLTEACGVTSMRAFLEDGLQAKAQTHVDGAREFVSDYRLDLPIADPGRIFCIGVNYMNRNEEYKDGQAAPTNPSVFMRGPLSFVPHGRDLVIPPESEQLDYEGEIVLVIGRPGRRISKAKALDHVAGLTIMNEGTIRDWVRHAKFNVTQGKNFDRTGGLGPWIETDLSGIDVTNMTVETRVNGEVRQSDTTASMAFPFAKIIEYLSTFTTLQIGDVIATGTPTGAGARFDPPIWLKQGDVVEVSVEGVGTLVNGVINEA
ncbi:fumarylacetoacetate hydrolase family protein [Pseudahrensia aquimaris]|uniref:Fumarylacetoacetate hydrolase family protein n=1 Tax=Pseudahrensia aquimaris TaxID=744461 RepID=A0ABW3FER9_9HYPH